MPGLNINERDHGYRVQAAAVYDPTTSFRHLIGAGKPIKPASKPQRVPKKVKKARRRK